MILAGFIIIILSIYAVNSILNDIGINAKEKVAYIAVIYSIGFISGLIFNIMLI